MMPDNPPTEAQPSPVYDPAENGRRGYGVAIAAIRRKFLAGEKINWPRGNQTDKFTPEEAQ